MATEGGASASPSPVDVDTTGALWEHYFPPGSLQQQQQQPQAGTGVGGDGSSRDPPPPLRNYLHPALACARVPTEGPGGVKEGRGVVARAAIRPGELLMVMKPLVAADVGAVFQAFRQRAASGAAPEGENNNDEEEEEEEGQRLLLESLVEDEMVKALQSLLAACPAARRAVVAMADGRLGEGSGSGGSGGGGGGGEKPLPDLELLMKEPAELQHETDDGEQAAAGEGKGGAMPEGEEGEEEREWLRAVLRHNAHGPEFKAYAQIERDWRSLPSSSSSPTSLIHPRLGGLYPVPSLLNHSCLANACRVFLPDGTMLVRATQPVAEGEELRWPYVPPLQPRALRQAALQAGFGFRCRCPRCRLEGGGGSESGGDGSGGADDDDGEAASSGYLALQRRVVGAVLRSKEEEAGAFLEALVDEVEEQLQAMAPESAEQRRWCRASFVDLYFAWFNAAGKGRGGGGQGEEDEVAAAAARKRARLRNELHWALSAVNNCSTEHLSLLHACYEAAGHQDGVNSKLSRFWVDQLTRAHQTRYGPPPSVAALRRLLQHTRLLLRTQDGYLRAAAAAGGGGGRGWFL